MALNTPTRKGAGPETTGLEPAWDIAHLFPLQGSWSEGDYLALETNHLVEFSDGTIEVLTMPSERHQDIVFLLATLLIAFVATKRLGKVLIAPFRIRLRENKYREPDVMFMLAENRDKRASQYWQGADLVMEVVSPDDPKRDTEVKLKEYAEAGIPEYWLVNPLTNSISVYTLREGADAYHVHGKFEAGTIASSVLLAGFTVDTSKVFMGLDDTEDV